MTTILIECQTENLESDNLIDELNQTVGTDNNFEKFEEDYFIIQSSYDDWEDFLDVLACLTRILAYQNIQQFTLSISGRLC